MSFSNYLETAVLGHVFGGSAYSAPASLYIGLHTANPDEDASGSEVSTVSTGYGRKVATFTVTGDTASTDVIIEFDTATASWGTVTHVSVWDASTAGNMLAYASLASSKAIETGDVLRIPLGDLDITLD